MSMITSGLSEAFRRWRDAPQHLRMRYRDDKHVPFNKKRHEVESSVLTMNFDRCDGQWLTVTTEETTVSHRGNIAGRSIMATLKEEEARKLAMFILFGDEKREFYINDHGELVVRKIEESSK